MDVNEAFIEIIDEYKRSKTLYCGFHSNHEGYAVILEEIDELWDEIKNCKETKGNDLIRAELIQIGAMVLRYLNELC